MESGGNHIKQSVRFANHRIGQCRASSGEGPTCIRIVARLAFIQNLLRKCLFGVSYLTACWKKAQGYLPFETSHFYGILVSATD